MSREGYAQCGGSGSDLDMTPCRGEGDGEPCRGERCEACGGSGEYPACRRCGGSGGDRAGPCPDCGGDGRDRSDAEAEDWREKYADERRKGL